MEQDVKIQIAKKLNELWSGQGEFAPPKLDLNASPDEDLDLWPWEDELNYEYYQGQIDGLYSTLRIIGGEDLRKEITALAISNEQIQQSEDGNLQVEVGRDSSPAA